jgi:23S rRNA pseudouridine1911/1915/1917 synthase
MANFVEFTITKNETVREFIEAFGVSKKTTYKQEMYNLIRVNGEIKKLHDRVKENDVISFKLAPLDGAVKPYNGEVKIVYEDEDLVIVNKPSGLLIHEDGNTFNTLTNRLNFHYQQQGIDYPVLPAHRLDYDTSGIVVFAKHFMSLADLSKQFEDQSVKKIYVAMVDNLMTKKEGQITYKIGKDRHSKKQVVTDTGKDASTYYKVINEFENQSKVEVEIKGGRTHQIRVHMAYIGHTLVGDVLYGKTPNSRLLLHFKKITLRHPRTHKPFSFTIEETF